MSAVPAVRATVAARSIVRRSEPRKLAAPSRSVAARAITETVAESQGADSALYDEFKKLLVDYEFSYKVGDRVSGKVFHCDAKGAWVDIGAKAAALCPTAEASLADVRNVSDRIRPSRQTPRAHSESNAYRPAPRRGRARVASAGSDASTALSGRHSRLARRPVWIKRCRVFRPQRPGPTR